MATEQNMAMTLTQKVIAIAVIIIIISMVALPIIQEDHPTVIEHQNTSYHYRMGTSDSVTISADSDLGIITVNGVNFDMADIPTTMPVAFTDNLWIRYATGGTLSLFGNGSLGNAAIAATSFTFADGVVSWTAGGSDYTQSYTSTVYHLDKNGKYGAYTTGDKFFINENTTIWNFNANGSVTNADLDPSTLTVRSSVASGPYNALRDSMINISTADVVPIRLTADYSSNVENLGEYLEFSVTSAMPYSVVTEDGTYSGTSTARIIAPITYTETIHSDDIPLFSVICIMLILVPLMMAVRMVTLKRN